MKTTCCIVGGGPAGIMLGYLLARAGIKTVVLEKHEDFFRDFRGDTVHPSTLQLLFELGLLERFLAIPHSEVEQFDFRLGNQMIAGPTFAHLSTHCRFVAFMPQWDFLNFLSSEAKRYPAFSLLTSTEAKTLVSVDGRVAGVRAEGKDGPLEISADLVVACDGRSSQLRVAADMLPVEYGSPIDVLWMRLPRVADDPGHLLATIGGGHAMIMIDRNAYWQCAFIVKKGAAADWKARGLPAFRAAILALAPYLGSRVDALREWDDVKLLTVAVNRLPQWWQPGLLFIGDAAHAMSPMGGVGINLAVQDAVSAANLLWRPLRYGSVGPFELAAVQRRREMPVRWIQTLQVFLQDRMLSGILGETAGRTESLIRLFASLPFVRTTAGRIVGVGFRPERIESPALP